MAKSLDELIEYLLEEIALNGEAGLTFQELAVLVPKFYQATTRQDLLQESESAAVRDSDRQFCSKVWAWLAQHCDVSVGQNHQYDNKTVDEIEQIFPGFTDLSCENVANPDTSLPAAAQNRGQPSLFVSKNRISIAICGHAPDPSRVFASEWKLLQLIAATRNHGIMQAELVRASGQDKRSVPRRTDMLHEKGYIVKENLYLKGNKTSRLYLRRYGEHLRSSSKNPGSTSKHLTVADVARQIFDILKNSPLVPQEDLCAALGATQPGRAHTLSLILRHFGRIGCLKRVMMEVEPSTGSHNLKLCIQYLREPGEEDWQNHSSPDLSFQESFEKAALLYGPDGGRHGSLISEHDLDDDLDEPTSLDAADETASKRSRSSVPQWNPDRILANTLYEAAFDAGSAGLTNAKARKIITGPFVKRTLESHMVKISTLALQAQPASLRHLAIVRTHNFRNSALQYLHFAFSNFASKVKGGLAKWEDASGGECFVKALKQTGKSMSTITDDITTDSFGFSLTAKPSSQVNNGRTTMAQMLRDAKIKNYRARDGEPVIKQVTSGKVDIEFAEEVAASSRKRHVNPLNKSTEDSASSHVRSPPSSIQHQALATLMEEPTATGIPQETISQTGTRTESFPPANLQFMDNDDHTVVRRGRPRKFTRGTEQYWREVFHFIVQERSPGHVKTKGIMDDPEALKVFRQRPPKFDDVVLRAIERGLPVASKSTDVSQSWMDVMIATMSRSKPGLYITPAGYQPGFRGAKSQHFILRSPRLCEVDWTDRRRCWPWQQLSSSASHSMRYQRFYPETSGFVSLSPALPSVVLETQPNSNARLIAPKSDPVESLTAPEQPTRTSATSDDQNLSQPIDLDKIAHMTGEIGGDREIRSRSEVAAKSDTPTDESIGPKHRNTSSAQQRVQKKKRKVSAVDGTRQGLKRSSRRRKLTQKAVESLAALAGASNGLDEPSEQDDLFPSHLSDASLFVDHDHTKDATVGDHASEDQAIVAPVIAAPHSSESDRGIGHDTGDGELLISDVQTHGSVAAVAQPDETPMAVEENADGQGSSVHFDQAEETLDPLPEDQVASHRILESADTTSILDTAVIPTAEADVEQHLDSARTRERSPHFAELTTAPVSAPTEQLASEHVIDAEDRGTPVRATSPSLNYLIPADEDAQPSIETEAPVRTKPARRRTRRDDLSEASRPQVSKLCRVLVLELIGLCSGLVPNVPWTLRRAMIPRWQEAGVTADQLNAKNVRAAIKAHCGSGKLKQITFAFSGKMGAVVKMSIVGLQGTDATSPAVLALQQRMIEMEPADYIPPELEAEGRRTPIESNKKRYSNLLYPVMPADAYAEQSKSPSPGHEIGESANAAFLTLKIPRLKELDMFAMSSSEEVSAITTSQTENNIASSRSTVKLQNSGKSRLKGHKRNTRLKPGNRKLIWKGSGGTRFPSSLDDIPGITSSREKARSKDPDNIRTAVFEAEIDCVAAWEQSISSVEDEAQSKPRAFINHCYLQSDQDSVEEWESIEYKAPIRFKPPLAGETDSSLPETQSWPASVTALEPIEKASNATSGQNLGQRTRRPTKRKLAMITDVADDQNQRQRRPRRPRLTVFSHDDAVTEPSLEVPLKRNRVTQLLRYMPDEEKYQVVTAVVVVRTLSGGIEKFIDWQIVYRLLPAQEQRTIKDAWKTLSNRYRSDIADLTEGLQHKYLEAFMSGEVATVNFDDIHGTDWEGIFQWALANLDKTLARRIEELPAKRAQLLRSNDYVLNEMTDVRELFMYNTIQTVPRKEEILAGTVFGKRCTLPGPAPTPLVAGDSEQGKDSDLLRARSWVVATLFTPEHRFDAAVIQTKLLTLAPDHRQVETLLEEAIKSLQQDKLISRSHQVLGIGRVRGQPSNDHEFGNLKQYEMSARFFEQLNSRRLVTTAMLNRAAKYKIEVLDAAFRQSATISLAKETVMADGEMVAILNLFAMGMLHIRPDEDVPASRWGLEWERLGYATRRLDKKALGFGVILSFNEHSYVSGDPLSVLRSTVRIPRGRLDQSNSQGVIPLWFDITHTFCADVWEMVLGVVLGLVSVRPGINVWELSQTLRHGASPAEIEMVLVWATELGLVRKTVTTTTTTSTPAAEPASDGNNVGWETRPWWWMGVGSGTGNDGVENDGGDGRAGSSIWRI